MSRSVTSIGQQKPVAARRVGAPVRGLAARPQLTRPLSTGLAPRIAPQLQNQRSVVARGLFGLGVPELVVIAGVAALIFGPSKLPELGKGLGKTVKSFQTAAKEFETELKAATADDAAGDKDKAAGDDAAAAAKKPEA